MNDLNLDKLFTIQETRQALEKIRTLDNLLPEFDKAEQCGIDCQQLREAVVGTRNSLLNIVKHYMPKDSNMSIPEA